MMSGLRTLRPVSVHSPERGCMLHVRIEAPPEPFALEALAEGLVRLNEWYMRVALEHGIEVPPLYQAGIVYRREPPGREWWETADDLLSIATKRSGDCEDLAAYRAAEIRVFENEHAILHVITTRRGTFHAVVMYPDGEIEDPSRICVDLEHERTRARKAG